MAQLTIGKVRGLQQISDPNGIFAICAMDHRGSLQRMLEPRQPERATYEAMVEVKQDLAELLSPVSTAVLLDPVYGAAQAIASGALRGGTGLLVSLEESGYEEKAQGRVTRLLEDWSVEKIRRMGASAVKVLLYYRPDLSDVAAKQRAVVVDVAEECRRVDIPFVLEPIAYPTAGDRDTAAFAVRKPRLVAQSAADLTPLGIDVLKAEFPGDSGVEGDDARLLAACEAVDAASRVPWVLLTGGASYETFTRQLIVACRAGASGFLGGRAVWEEALRLPDRRERRRWLESSGVDRMRRLHEIAGEFGRPWWRKHGNSLEDVVRLAEDWYRHYDAEAP